MIEALAPAKINLFLYVGPRRADGYHPVCSLMEKISIFDRLSIEVTGNNGFSLTGGGLPPGENTVEKAARLLAAATGSDFHAAISLVKEIPVAAGLAGGSSDAAAAMRLLILACRLSEPPEKLRELAWQIGADVPFFLKDGPLLAEGAGEILKPVSLPVDYSAVVVTPAAQISTAQVYNLFDDVCEVTARSFSEISSRAVEDLSSIRDVGRLAGMLHNDLEPVTTKLCPDIKTIKNKLMEAGAAGALMSGSGPSVFGLFADSDAAETVAAGLRGSYPFVKKSVPVRSSMPAPPQ